MTTVKPKLEAVVQVGTRQRERAAVDKLRAILAAPEHQDLMAELVERYGAFDFRVWVSPVRVSQEKDSANG